MDVPSHGLQNLLLGVKPRRVHLESLSSGSPASVSTIDVEPVRDVIRFGQEDEREEVPARLLHLDQVLGRQMLLQDFRLPFAD